VPDTADMIVVGGGPVGLYALYYAGLRSMKATLIDSLPTLGGQLQHLYPDNDVWDVAGVPKITARELVENLKKQALQFKPTVRLGERVLGIHQREGIFDVVTDKGQYAARTVLLAIGPGAVIPGGIFDKPKEEQEKMGLFLDPHDVSVLTGKRVLICGGKQEAIGWAIEAATVAESVTTITWFDIYESDEARIDPTFNRVDVMTPYMLRKIHGTDRITAATIAHCVTNEEIRLKVDAVLMARGQLCNMETVSAWGVEMLNGGIKVDRSMRTSVPGIYAAGDVVVYPGKVRTINAGAGEAAIAVNNAKALVDPGSTVQPPYTAEN
jgi:thioredoxin reductase (NADPH)